MLQNSTFIGVEQHFLKLAALFLACLFFLEIRSANCQNSDAGLIFFKNKNLTANPKQPSSPFFQQNFDWKKFEPFAKVARPQALALPKWSAETLPFFCKIEHRAAKHLPLPMKFRLGSVNYVDWLEGKSCTGSPDF